MIYLAISSPWILLIDVFFVVTLSVSITWYFYFYKRRELLGGYIGGVVIAVLGSLLFFAFFQKIVRDIIMWFMSPKIGTNQLSNVNLIVIAMGAFLALFLIDKIQKKPRK